MKKTNIYYSIILFLATTFTSCQKYLDVKPTAALANNVAIVDAGTARSAILGAYHQVQNYYQLNYPVLGFLTADNVIFNGTLSQYLQVDQNAITPDNPITSAAWASIYQAINSANNVIAALPNVTDPVLGAAEKSQILGDAYFIRALGYFDLGRGWGGVQLQLKPTTDLAGLKGIKRSTLDQTYDQVLADLIQAEQLLPEDNSTRNRAQKSVVRALRARLHLYRGQWSDAEKYATQVLNNSKYALVTPYKSFFAAPFLSKESVFELSFSSANPNSQWNFWFPSSLGGQFTLQPSTKLIAQLNDPTIGGGRNALIATTVNGNSTVTYGALYYRSAAKDDPAYLIRLAELYLIRAEARAQQNNLTDGLADLNVIRTRAGIAASTAATQGSLLLAIENENSIEFAFEAHRWFDLVRTKRAGDVLGVTNTDYWLFPVPFVDVSSDPDVTQNHGYQ